MKKRDYRYQNMLAEMDREGITIADAAELLGMSARVFELKLDGRLAFTVDEVSTLRAALLPDATLDYLMEPNMDHDPGDGLLVPADRLALFTRYLCDVYGLDVEQLANELGVDARKLKDAMTADGLDGWTVGTVMPLLGVIPRGRAAEFMAGVLEPERCMEATRKRVRK